ncbi:hypothetical protein [Streptomyces sp. cmx-4-9]|uniref:hypothetical protein n=1 Tax=Streptomyces sp. cmx-4-9 TaxID=2790941 RepID=UPI0039803F1A
MADFGTVTGKWATKTGASLTFKADRTLESRGLRFDPSLVSGCPSGAGRGNWAFYVDKGKPGGLVGMDEKAQSGQIVGVTFNDIPQGSCTITLSVIRDGSTLCVSMDPDQVCSFKDRFTRVGQNPEQSPAAEPSAGRS